MERNHVPRSYKSTGKRGSRSFLLPRPREVWDLPAVTVRVGPRPLLPLRGCPSGPTGGAPNCRNQASTLRADPTACLARAGVGGPAVHRSPMATMCCKGDREGGAAAGQRLDLGEGSVVETALSPAGAERGASPGGRRVSHAERGHWPWGWRGPGEPVGSAGGQRSLGLRPPPRGGEGHSAPLEGLLVAPTCSQGRWGLVTRGVVRLTAPF